MFAALVPVIPPLNPAPVGGDQLKVVPNGMAPFVPSVGVKIKAIPPQVTVDIGLITATGLTVMVTVNVAPFPQATVLGVTIYVAVPAVVVELLIVPVILVALFPIPPPLNPPVREGADQV